MARLKSTYQARISEAPSTHSFTFAQVRSCTLWELAPDDEGTLQPVEADPISIFEWDFFLPAFRLATMLITHDRFLDWWIVLTHGRVEPAGRDHDTYPLLRYPAGDRSLLRMGTLRKLEELSQRLNISFRDTVHETWGAAWNLRNGVEIELDSGYLDFARQALRQQAQRSGTSLPFETDARRNNEMTITTEQTLRVQWMMAVTFCHELCHAAWMLRHPYDEYMLPTEPNHCMDPRPYPAPELGHAWTYWLFGFSPNNIVPGDIFDFVHGVRRRLPTESFVFGVAASFEGMNWPVYEPRYVRSPLTNMYIASWFREETWASIRASQATDLRAFVQLTPIAMILGPNGVYEGRLGNTMAVFEHSRIPN